MSDRPADHPRIVPPQAHGVLVLDKPSGPTSTRCLETIKHRLGQKKIGHAGTLDPMAAGVLIVLLGQATKLASYVMEAGDKVYRGRLELGLTTDTYDIEGTVVSRTDCSRVTPGDLEAEVKAWLDQTEQEVPAYSAAKHEGKPLYALARRGLDTPVKTKAIRISRAEVLDMDLPRAGFRVRCSTGTYIRSLVHSLGMRLGCGATLTELVREYSHPFGLDQALSLESLLAEPEAFPSKVLPLTAALPHWPLVSLSEADAALVKNGAWLPAEAADTDQQAVLAAPDGTPLALVEARPTEGRMRWAILRGLW